MDNSLQLMYAYLERFNVIQVYVDNSYYQGIVKSFFLKDIEEGLTTPMKVIYDYIDGDYHIYELLVDNIVLGKTYEVMNGYGLSRVVTMNKIVNDPLFDHLYSYDKNDLGATYFKDHTIFKVWAPTASSVKLQYTMNHEVFIKEMKRGKRGVYSVTVYEDLDSVPYVYLVGNGDLFKKTIDPYGYASTVNGNESVVINLDKVVKQQKSTVHYDSFVDTIIYEASIRDFTSSIELQKNKQKTYLGFVEEGLKTKKGNLAGIDYLVDLGITHVQLMPFYDFASVDETAPDTMYNWGYDPMQYGVPEGSYCSDCNDPYSRINECITMINKLHEVGLNVVMDVVYNHVYDVTRNALESTVPGYFFRNDDQGNMSNGSFCSNDLNSASYMVRKYIVDMCIRWKTMYGVDGYRFDLMGILDIETMKRIQQEMISLDKYFMIYGEGWNLPTMLPDQDKAMIDNHQSLPNIGFFNDRFRDFVKGQDHNGFLGYFSGNTNLINETIDVLVNNGVIGNPIQSINYVACHDNLTLFDYVSKFIHVDQTIACKIQKIINTVVLLSPGVPFIHNGQEFCRTNGGIDNCYNMPDSINTTDWNRIDEFEDQVDWLKKMIQLRKSNFGFRCKSNEEIQKTIRYEVIENNVLLSRVTQENGKYKEIVVLLNPTSHTAHVCLDYDQEVLLTSATQLKQELSMCCIDPYEVYIIVKK